jgi:hypothetical protein
MQTTRRGFVMLGAALAAQIPFLSNANVATATTAIEKAAGVAPPPAAEPEEPRLRREERPPVTLARPGLAGEFFIESIDVAHDHFEYNHLGLRRYVPMQRSVRVTLVSTGPVTVSGDWAFMGDSVKLYLPSAA